MSPAKHGRHIGIMISSSSALSSVASHFWFLINNFWRDSSISFNVNRKIKHHKIQVKFEFGDHLQILDREMAFLTLRFWLIFGFRSITFERIHQFNLSEG